ncbi:hypothetical protein [Mesonia sp. K7]|uniref:hypothetical protein n=1 Tax=Mesonia sp. K7 TaxID=2218606 RepID=UPI000DA746C0|nr:hypothetical protein [Mesonia sp. K7]PZD79087.1 hypothetical protein DNG35_03520 [Mesonia sp. K7]
MEFTRYTLKLLLCLIFVGLVGCEPDIEIEKEEVGQEISNHTHDIPSISFSEFKKQTGQDPSVLRGYAARGGEAFITEIDTTQIYVVRLENMTSYNFGVRTIADTLGTFSNLVYFERPEQEIETVLIQYHPRVEWWEEQPIDLIGGVSTIEENNYEITTHQTSYFTTEIVVINCTGGNHEPGHPNCNCHLPNVDCLPGYSYEIVSIVLHDGGGGAPVSGTNPTLPGSGSGGTGSTQSGNPVNYGTVPNPILVYPISREFFSLLDAPENTEYQDWWESLRDIESTILLSDYISHPNSDLTIALEIIQFFIDNGVNAESLAFAKEAKSVLLQDGEVDWEELIIIDINDECQRKIISDVIDSDTLLMDILKDTFNDQNDDIKLIVTSDNISTNASTSSVIHYNAQTKDCFINITFNENYLQNGTDLSIARTMIHESIHALLLYGVLNGLFSVNGQTDPDYTELMDAFLLYMHNSSSSHYSGEQHEIIADLNDDITLTLENYGNMNGYNLNSNYYKTLSWGGLLETDAFKEIYPMHLPNGDINPQWVSIVNTIAAEQDNSNNYNDGQGNPIMPKGNPCP